MGLFNICPSAGDFVILPEATCHGSMSLRDAHHGQRLVKLRFQSQELFDSSHLAYHHPAALPQPPSPQMLALLSGDTNALHAMCRPGFRPAPDPGPAPPPLEHRRCWQAGHSLDAQPPSSDGAGDGARPVRSKVANDAVYGQGVRDSTVPEPTDVAVLEADGQCGGLAMTAEQRYMFDAQGVLILRGVSKPGISPSEKCG